MSFQQFVSVLRARWVVVFSVFLVIFLASCIATVLLPKQYLATSSIVVDTKPDPIGGLMTALTEQMLQNYVTTQVDIISSRRVALRVVSKLKLEQDPELLKEWQEKLNSWTSWFADSQGGFNDWIVLLLEKRLRVTPSRESSVIEISVKWPDAKMAADLANAFAQSAIETNIELKVEPAKQYASWFSERSGAMRADLEKKQHRLSDFQAATGIVATDEKLDIENARLTELSTELVAIQSQRQDSQSRQRQVGEHNESLPEVLQSPIIADLKSDLSDAEAKKADIAARLGKNHPDYQAADATVAALHARIDQEISKITASLGSATAVNVRREADVRLAMEAQKKRVLELKHQHDEAAVLQNDVTTAQRDLDAVTQRLAQSNLESEMQQTNVAQLTFAIPPLIHSSPKVVLDLLLGLLFGAVAGIAGAFIFEARDPRVRDEMELARLIGAPILGRVSFIKSATSTRPPASGDESRLGFLAT